jgi:hypothetical protein
MKPPNYDPQAEDELRKEALKHKSHPKTPDFNLPGFENENEEGFVENEMNA